MQLMIVVPKYLAEDLRGKFIAQEEIGLFHAKETKPAKMQDLILLS